MSRKSSTGAATPHTAESDSHHVNKKRKTEVGSDAAAASALPSASKSMNDEDQQQEEEEDAADQSMDMKADDSSDSSSAGSSSSDSESDSDSDSESSSAASASIPSAVGKQTRPLQLRNYTPHDTNLKFVKVAPIDLEQDHAWMDAELQKIIEAALNNENEDAALLRIKSKPLNWDLKRDLAPAFSTLQAETQRKIRDLIQKQIDEQKKQKGGESSSSSSDESSSDSSDEEDNAK